MNGLFGSASTATCWGAVVLVWAASGIYNTARAPHERDRAKFASTPVLIGVIATCADLGVVGRTFGHDLAIGAFWVRVAGLVVLVPSTAFVSWARLSLGTMWSFGSTVKDHHRLRTRAHAVTRHPIYTGLLGMLLGTTLVNGVHQWIVLVPVGVILLEVKLRTEERVMLATFPDEYPKYCRQVPQLVPGLRRVVSRLRRAEAHKEPS